MTMTFDEYLDLITNSSMQEIVAAQSPEFQGLLTQACNMFERFRHSDQLVAMACMTGMILGTLEGEIVPAEALLGVMITHRERLQQFEAQAMVVFYEAMAARGQTLPRERIRWAKTKKPKALPKRKGARVLQIVSGKRKKRKP